jgi:hypothetical protein
MPKSIARPFTWSNFAQMLIAILAGNFLYYLAMPHLPERARHHIFREDWGVVVDFWFCLVIFGAIKTVIYLRQKRSQKMHT